MSHSCRTELPPLRHGATWGRSAKIAESIEFVGDPSRTGMAAGTNGLPWLTFLTVTIGPNMLFQAWLTRQTYRAARRRQWSIGWHDDAHRPFASRRFAEAVLPKGRAVMRWPPDPQMRSPTPGQRGARYSHGGASDGSAIELYHFGISESTIFDGAVATSRCDILSWATTKGLSVVETSTPQSAPTR